ncbi:MAG TPA: hypothetical protein VF619_08560 [Allosphingosinicella sp.]|jgi:hypothetical protein
MRIRSLALALCMPVAVGCAQEGQPAVENAARNGPAERMEAASGGEVRLLTFKEASAAANQPAPTYHMASISGRLLVRSGCLALEAGGRTFALVFREGTVDYDPERLVLTVEGSGFPIGSRVQLGGSGGSAVASEPAAGEISRCGADSAWYVTPGSFGRG